MQDAFLFVGLPYLAIVTAVVGTIWRWRTQRYSWTSRSSQFLEDRQLLWGSAPWHIGIGLVLLGHLAVAFFPTVWTSLMSVPGMLLAVETVGMGAALLAVIGLTLLLIRRVTSSRVQAVTVPLDLVVVGLLLTQVILGMATAAMYRYGALWSAGTAVPYVWGILTLQPDMRYVADFPVLFKLHIVGAWLLILLLPFTRLVHLLSLPLAYLWRAPQLVIWNTRRRREHAIEATIAQDSRREFLKGVAGVAGATGLLSLGVSEKLAGFFKGPHHDLEAETAMLQKKLQRLQQTAEERELELERRRSSVILVTRYADLVENKGIYFTDYNMAPGLAFKGSDGWPLVRSAKCTHLGCTVSSDVDANGRILCPCHISYFDVRTGQPNSDAPAKRPLPTLGWVLMDAGGKVVAGQEPGQPVQGAADAALLAGCTLYITKPSTNGAA